MTDMLDVLLNEIVNHGWLLILEHCDNLLSEHRERGIVLVTGQHALNDPYVRRISALAIKRFRCSTACSIGHIRPVVGG